MDCIFCKVVAGEIPSEKLHETENLIVIRDIEPQAPTHLLVIPKEHLSSLNDCGDTLLLGELLNAAPIMAHKFGIAERGYRVVINTNEEGGQTVFHLHMHILGGKAMSPDMD